jgi:hypothetical protein
VALISVRCFFLAHDQIFSSAPKARLQLAQVHFTLFLIGIMGGGVQLDPLDTAATNMPIVPAQVLMMMEKLVELLAGETAVLGENLSPSAALSITNPTCCPEANLVRRGGKPVTNRLSYGTAYTLHVTYRRQFCLSGSIGWSRGQSLYATEQVCKEAASPEAEVATRQDPSDDCLLTLFI